MKTLFRADLRKQAASGFMVVVACLTASLAGCKKTVEETPPTLVQVQAAHPIIGEISEEIGADAILAPLAQAALVPRITAPIRTLYVERGKRVHKGQTLVALDASDLQSTAVDLQGGLLQAKAAYSTATRATIPEEMQRAQLDVDQTRANLQLAERTERERKQLLEQGAIAGRDVDTAVSARVAAKAAYDVAVKHLQSVRATTSNASAEAAQGQLTSAEGKLGNAQAQVAFATLRSPINGIVTDRPYFAGETAPPGAAVVTVMDTSSLLAKLHLAQASAQQLALGREAEITVPGASGPVKATVSFISPALDPGSTTVEVWLKLPNNAGTFKVGTPVHATINGRWKEQVISIPTSALLPAQDGSGAIMTIGADGNAHRKPVQIGIRNEEAVEITQGLTPSDTVITEGSYGIDDGTKVEVVASKPDAKDKD